MSTTLHIDGGSRGNPGPSAAGVVLRRDDQPLVEAGFLLGRMTNNQAEYHALLRGLAIAAETCPADELAIYSDSELLVKQLTGQYEVKNAELRKLVEEVHQLLWKFDTPPQFRHVLRSENRRADQLVNAALDAKHHVIAVNTANVRLEGEAAEPAMKPDSGNPTAGLTESGSTEPDTTKSSPIASGPVTVTCLQHPIDGNCPADCRGQAKWAFGDRIPANFCTHAGAAVLPAVSAMLQAPLPDDEDPDDFAEITVRCPRRECQAVFRIGYSPRNG